MPIAPSATAATLKKALEGIPTIANWEASTDAVVVSTSGATVCTNGGESTSTITLNREVGDTPPFYITNRLSSNSGNTPTIYMETVYNFQCVCGANCGGTIIFQYQDEFTADIAIGETAANIKTAIEGLGNLPDDIAVTATFTSGAAMCVSSSTTTFSITFQSLMGNLAELGTI